MKDLIALFRRWLSDLRVKLRARRIWRGKMKRRTPEIDEHAREALDDAALTNTIRSANAWRKGISR